ncbi:MAG: hypothetical protein ACI9UK_001188 [Candidatus Krumholzibacteriia bacterium]|jgi:hypothetical protein
MQMTRDEAQLLLAAIRVKAHLQGRSPTVTEVADLLDRSETEVRLQLNTLAELGAAKIIDSAYESHAEIVDYLQVEHLSAEAGPALSEDLKNFERSQQQEADRLAKLFDSGDHQKKDKEQRESMDEDFKSFQSQKPKNPFGDE